jgi:hypothetical protein
VLQHSVCVVSQSTTGSEHNSTCERRSWVGLPLFSRSYSLLTMGLTEATYKFFGDQHHCTIELILFPDLIIVPCSPCTLHACSNPSFLAAGLLGLKPS